jgi:hypothetical protein
VSDENGKAALFSQNPASVRRRPANTGRRAFFSAAPRTRGSVVVECQTCEARTPVPLVELPVRLVPSLWIPGRPYSRWMWCPSCRHPTWCRIDWRAALG